MTDDLKTAGVGGGVPPAPLEPHLFDGEHCPACHPVGQEALICHECGEERPILTDGSYRCRQGIHNGRWFHGGINEGCYAAWVTRYNRAKQAGFMDPAYQADLETVWRRRQLRRPDLVQKLAEAAQQIRTLRIENARFHNGELLGSHGRQQADRIVELEAQIRTLQEERDDLQRRLTEAFDSEVLIGSAGLRQPKRADAAEADLRTRTEELSKARWELEDAHAQRITRTEERDTLQAKLDQRIL